MKLYLELNTDYLRDFKIIRIAENPFGVNTNYIENELHVCAIVNSEDIHKISIRKKLSKNFHKWPNQIKPYTGIFIYIEKDIEYTFLYKNGTIKNTHTEKDVDKWSAIWR